MSAVTQTPISPTPPCLIWDVDGTLIDTTVLIVESLQHIYTTYFDKHLSSEECRALIGTPLKAQVRIFGEPEEFGVATETVMEAFITYYEAGRDRERVLEEVIAILQDGKRQGFPTALVTSKNIPELENTLPRLGIVEFVDAIVSADHVKQPKPAPEGILQALDRLDIPAEVRPNAVYIGDTTHDMQAARDAGVRGIGVLWGAATQVYLEKESPFALCATPAELRRLLLL